MAGFTDTLGWITTSAQQKRQQLAQQQAQQQNVLQDTLSNFMAQQERQRAQDAQTAERAGGLGMEVRQDPQLQQFAEIGRRVVEQESAAAEAKRQAEEQRAINEINLKKALDFAEKLMQARNVAAISDERNKTTLERQRMSDAAAYQRALLYARNAGRSSSSSTPELRAKQIELSSLDKDAMQLETAIRTSAQLEGKAIIPAERALHAAHVREAQARLQEINKQRGSIRQQLQLMYPTENSASAPEDLPDLPALPEDDDENEDARLRRIMDE